MLLSEDMQDGRGRVRPMARHDLPVVSALIARLAQHHGDTAWIDISRLEADLFAPSPWIYGLVAERFSFVVGYALMTQRYIAQRTERGIDLHHLFVIEGSRGLGLGRQLVASVVDFAREAECSFLDVGTRADNRQAQAFYRSLGFAPRERTGQSFAMMVQ